MAQFFNGSFVILSEKEYEDLLNLPRSITIECPELDIGAALEALANSDSGFWSRGGVPSSELFLTMVKAAFKK